MDVVFSFVATGIPAMRSSEPRIVAALSRNNVTQLRRDVAHNNAQTFVRVTRCFYKDAILFYVLHKQIKKRIHYVFFLSTTNKMQNYIIFFITVNALHVSGVSPPIIRSSRTVHTASGMCTVLELLMMGGETARNM